MLCNEIIKLPHRTHSPSHKLETNFILLDSYRCIDAALHTR